MPTWMYGSEVGFVGAVGYFDPVWEEEALRSAETYVTGLAERLRKTGLHVETRALRGEIASTIHAVSDETDTDLVVMSTHAANRPSQGRAGERRRRGCADESSAGAAGSAARRDPRRQGGRP